VSHDVRYLKGIELFNKGDYFEAHEVWEDLWHGTHDKSKNFIQGLIQVTSAFHHFSNANLRGARILHNSGVELLSPYKDRMMGMDVKGLLERFDHSFRGLLEPSLDQLPGRGRPGSVQVSFTPDRIFKITLTDSP